MSQRLRKRVDCFGNLSLVMPSFLFLYFLSLLLPFSLLESPLLLSSRHSRQVVALVSLGNLFIDVLVWCEIVRFSSSFVLTNGLVNLDTDPEDPCFLFASKERGCFSLRNESFCLSRMNPPSIFLRWNRFPTLFFPKT